MMESDYDLPSLHCYTMNPASEPMVTSHPRTQPQQPQQHMVSSVPTTNTTASTTTTTTAVSTTPLKRTRAKRSCDFCRQRKSRCDADTCTPCTNCKAWGYTCEFQTVRKKRGPPSVYVDNLEKRCKKMEQLLMQLTNTPIKDLEQNDFRTTHRRAISDPSIVSDSSSDDEEDEVNTDKGYSPIVSSQQQQQQHDAFMTPCSSSTTTTNDTTPPTPLDNANSTAAATTTINDSDIIHRLGKLDIHDYDSIKYTGQSAGLELLDHQDIFKSKPYIAWPGRRDTVLQMLADDQLMVVRTEKSATTGKIDTRLDVGISITSVPSSPSTLSNAIVHDNNHHKPPKSLVTHMVTLYFTHLHPILPIINKIRFLHLYESHSPLLPKVLLQAVLAISFRFAAQQQLHLPATTTIQQTEQYADYFFRKVMKKLQQASARSRLCYVQAGLLTTLYLDLWHQPDSNSNNMESVQWQVLGQAIRMAQDLGLHRTCEHWQLPASEIETRHRVFYACYVLDRWIGARAGKPLTILDRDFDAAMPSMYEVVDTPNEDVQQRLPVYRAFYLWIKLSEILGRVLKALYAPSAKKANSNANLDDPMILVVLDRRLKHWHALLEEPVDNTYLPKTQNVSLQIYYNTVILLLRRPFLSTLHFSNVDEQLVTESRQLSLQAALNIFQLVQQIKPQQQPQQQIAATDETGYIGPLHLLPTCCVYAMFLSSLVHVALVLQDRTSIKKRRALTASVGLMEAHQHLCASRRALEIIHMLVTIHEINPPSSPEQGDDDDAMEFKPIKLEYTQNNSTTITEDDPAYMISHYNAQEDHDEILDPYSTAAPSHGDRPPLGFQQHHHHHHPSSPFDSNFITSCPPPSTGAIVTATTTTATSTSFIESEMPKSHWFQRFVNTSVVGGVPSEIQHDVASDLSHQTTTTSYLCPPPSSMLPNNNNNNNNNNNTNSHLISAHQPPSSSMFYTPYMPSPPMPTSASPSTSTTDLHVYPPHHLPLLSTASPEEHPSSAPSAAHRPPLFLTTTTIGAPTNAIPAPLRPNTCNTMPLHHHPPPPAISPSNLNWHDWQFYMHQHPPSSPLSK